MKKIFGDQMKKKHHKDGHMHHMRGTEGKGKGFVTGHDEHVGMGDFANMPQHVVMKEFPPSKEMRGGNIDDTITGVDHVNSVAEGKRSRFMSNQK